MQQYQSDYNFIKRQTNRIHLLRCLLLITLAFIWLHSAMPGDVSSGESGFMTRLLAPVLELILGKGNVSEHLVRKLAHFSEYFIFGAELSAYLAMTGNSFNPLSDLAEFTDRIKENRIKENAAFRIISAQLSVVNLALITAFLDETIQIFSGRGPMIADVWIDISGAFCGSLLLFFMQYVLSYLPGKKII